MCFGRKLRSRQFSLELKWDWSEELTHNSSLTPDPPTSPSRRHLKVPLRLLPAAGIRRATGSSTLQALGTLLPFV